MNKANKTLNVGDIVRVVVENSFATGMCGQISEIVCGTDYNIVVNLYSCSAQKLEPYCFSKSEVKAIY